MNHRQKGPVRCRRFRPRSMAVLATACAVAGAGPVIGAVAPGNAHMAQSGFAPTIVNIAPAPGPAPAGMAWIPGGEFSMGANDPPDMDDVGMKATRDARPIQ